MLQCKYINHQFNRIKNKIRNYHDAEDVLSEALLAYYDKASKTTIDKPKQLFNKIVSYKIKDYYRSKKNNERVQFLNNYDIEDNKGGEIMNYMREVLKSEEYNIMMMRYVYGYSYDYICNTLKIRRGKLAKILRRIKLELLTMR